MAKDTGKRVVGVLLGEHNKGQLDVTNSYAVPFEEDERDPSVWFLDHSYHESMFSMFKRINGSRFRFLSLSSTTSLSAYSCFRASVLPCFPQPPHSERTGCWLVQHRSEASRG